MDIEQEEIENIDKPEKKKLTFHSPLIPLLENTIKQNPIKELKKLSEELIKFNEYKEEIATTITNPDKLKKLQETFKFKLLSKLENLVIDALNMRVKENKNERIKKIYDWYNDKYDYFLQLKEMKERTTQDINQIELEEPKKEEHYLTLKEINEHRSDIKGYENASKRLKNFNRKNIENKATKEIKFAFKDGVNLNYYYKENGFNNTLTSFKENISASSTYYDTFYKKNKIEINTGSDWFRRTGLDFSKEQKSSYSFIRPKYEYNFLSVEKDINIEKNKLIKEKRNEEERIKAMKEFAFRKSFYNSNVNQKNEMKELLNLYKVIFKEKKEEEVLRIKEEEELRIKEEEELRIKEEEERKKKEEEEKKKKEEEEKKTINYKKRESEEEEEDKEEEKEEEKNINVLEEIKVLKPKIDLNNIKYIGPVSNEKETKNKMRQTLNNNEINEKVFSINIKIKQVELKKKTIDSKIKYKIEKDLEMKENEQNNIKNKKEFPLQSDIASFRDFTNRTSYLRKINTKLNDINNIDVPKNNYFQHFNPLSYFDNKNYTSFRKEERFNSEDKEEKNILLKTFSNFKNDFLSMRRTISNLHEQQMRNSKLYSRGGKRLRIKLDEL